VSEVKRQTLINIVDNKGHEQGNHS
jgi:hypothetical protein